MCPRLENRGQSVNIPDESGVYETVLGTVKVDASQLKPGKGQKSITVESDWIKGWPGRATENGKRTIQIASSTGIGSDKLKRGEGKLKVTLRRPLEGRGLGGEIVDSYYPDYPELSHKGRLKDYEWAKEVYPPEPK